uniref:Uncharacterized protein n=1 Tax=Anguilla anguilla TaxID=7936 RepID=A0A0E9PMB0_ANGAN
MSQGNAKVLRGAKVLRRNAKSIVRERKSS